MSLSPQKTRLLTMAHVEFVKKNARSLPEPEKWSREKRPKGAEQESQHQLVPSRSLTASFPLKSYRNPIGKAIVFQPTFFRGELLNFGGVWE